MARAHVREPIYMKDPSTGNLKLAAGASVQVCQPGTTTAFVGNVWNASSGGSNVGSTLPALGSDGVAQFWLDTQQDVDLVVTLSGFTNLQYTASALDTLDSATGTAGGDLTGTYPNPSVAATVLKYSNPTRNVIYAPSGTSMTQINAWGASLNGVGRGVLKFEPGATVVLDTPMILYSGVRYRGNGTQVRVANGTNADAYIQGQNFLSLTGTTTNAGWYHNGTLEDFSFDGNVANQSSGNGIGLGVFGGGYKVRGCTFHDFRGPGMWTELNPDYLGGFVTMDTLALTPTPNGDYVSVFDDIYIYNCATAGIKAPTTNNFNANQVSAQWCQFTVDAIASHIKIYQRNTAVAHQRAMLVGASATGQNGNLQLSNSHFYLNHDTVIDLSGNPSLITNCHFEGAGTGGSVEKANILLRSTGTRVINTWSYSTAAGGIGLYLAGGSQQRVEILMSSLGSGSTFVNYVAGTGGYFAECTQGAVATACTLINGTIPISCPAGIRGDGNGHITGSNLIQAGS